MSLYDVIYVGAAMDAQVPWEYLQRLAQDPERNAGAMAQRIDVPHERPLWLHPDGEWREQPAPEHRAYWRRRLERRPRWTQEAGPGGEGPIRVHRATYKGMSLQIDEYADGALAWRVDDHPAGRGTVYRQRAGDVTPAEEAIMAYLAAKGLVGW